MNREKYLPNGKPSSKPKFLLLSGLAKSLPVTAPRCFSAQCATGTRDWVDENAAVFQMLLWKCSIHTDAEVVTGFSAVHAAFEQTNGIPTCNGLKRAPVLPSMTFELDTHSRKVYECIEEYEANSLNVGSPENVPVYRHYSACIRGDVSTQSRTPGMSNISYKIKTILELGLL